MLIQDLAHEMHYFYQFKADILSQINFSHCPLFSFVLGCFQSSDLDLILKLVLEVVEGVFT